MSVLDFSTPHTGDTSAPQTYWQHFGVALWGSMRLMGYGLGGIWHAFFPEHARFQFWTSSGVIRIYREIEMIGRHDDEIERIFSAERRAYVERNRGG
jgi:hypothetical protein